MIFQNPQIDIDLLPKVESVEMISPARNYLKVILLSTSSFLLFLLAGLGVAYFIATETPFPYFFHFLIGLWISIAMLSLLYSWRSYHNQAYALREKDIIYKKGVLTQSLTTIPFNRVQHCEITQGPIERYFDLKTLQVFTAGGQSSDLEVPGLSGEKAQELKEFIIKTSTQDGRNEEE